MYLPVSFQWSLLYSPDITFVPYFGANLNLFTVIFGIYDISILNPLVFNYFGEIVMFV
jgi:hypothetical protein